MHHHMHKKERIIIAAIATGAAILLIALGAFTYLRTSPLSLSVVHPVAQPLGTISLLSYLLGFDSERTFLVLFLNNTELRPAGGFIGTYALVQLQNGHVNNLIMQGSETLDYAAPIPQEYYPPPKPMADYLKVKQWHFRDSNWSPDFAESSKWGMWLYRFEKGEAADRVDGVIGITTNALEELVAITGPVTADGVTLRPGSAVADLEYEVEYGFNEKGIAVMARKEIMRDIGKELFRKIMAQGPAHLGKLLGLVKKLGAEKHVIMYSVNPEVQEILRTHGWSGEMPSFTEGDGFMVVDANLGALKTDHAITRDYSYKIEHGESGMLTGTLTVHYTHTGTYDWRTSRYRSYTRVYLPADATVQSVQGFVDPELSSVEVPPDYGARPGMQVLGGYIRLAPGESHDLVITYTLPLRIVRNVNAGSYTLTVPKQIGLVDPGLTVDLDFGKTIRQTGKERYTETRVLREDYTRQLNF